MKNRMKLLKMIAISVTLLILPVYSYSQQLDEKDIAIISDVCSSLKTPARKTACDDALARIIEKNAYTPSAPKSPKPVETTEEITFKGIPLDQPGQSGRLHQICAEKKGNDRCNLINNYDTSVFTVDYGTLTDAIMGFQLDNRGALVSVIFNNIFGEPILGLVKVLSDKYGIPLVENDEVQNRLGNKFPRQIYRWTDTRGNMIEVNSSCDKIGQGCFNIKAASLLAKDVEKIRRILNDGRKQL